MFNYIKKLLRKEQITYSYNWTSIDYKGKAPVVVSGNIPSYSIPYRNFTNEVTYDEAVAANIKNSQQEVDKRTKKVLNTLEDLYYNTEELKGNYIVFNKVEYSNKK